MKFSPINQCLSYLMQVIKGRLMTTLIQPFTWDSSLESLEPWTAALIMTGRSRGQGVQRNKSSKGGNIEAVSCSLTRSNKLCPPCYQSSSLTASLSISSTHPWQPPSASLQSWSSGVMEQVWFSKLHTEPQLQFITDSQPCYFIIIKVACNMAVYIPFYFLILSSF